MFCVDIDEIEEKCEGKTILTLSATNFGMVIRFTDFSILTLINGRLEYKEGGWQNESNKD